MFQQRICFSNRRQRRKTQKLFSCPSLEPLYISAHFASSVVIFEPQTTRKDTETFFLSLSWTIIYFSAFCVFCCYFWTADNAERHRNFFLVSYLSHYIFLRISAYSAVSFICFIRFICWSSNDTNYTNLIFVSFVSSVVFFNRRQRRKTQKLFSCPSLEPLYISAHFCVFCGSIFSDFMYILSSCPSCSPLAPITMSDVSRTFFIPLSVESSRCRTGWRNQ